MVLRKAVVVTSAAMATLLCLPAAAEAKSPEDGPGPAKIIRTISVQRGGKTYVHVLRAGNFENKRGLPTFGLRHIQQRVQDDKSADVENRSSQHEDALHVMDTEWENAFKKGVARTQRAEKPGVRKYIYSTPVTLPGESEERNLCLVEGGDDLIYLKKNYGAIGIITAFVKPPGVSC